VIHLFLFDVDSVLVEARGYLRALQDTVAHFSQQMGLGRLPPVEEEVQIFEAGGLTSEWDSGAACVAALLLERVRREPTLSLPSDWPEALSFLAAHPLPLPRPDYALLARRVGERIGGGVSPAQAVRAVLLEEARTVPGLDSTLAALLDVLLGHTHDLDAPVARYFQHLAVGSRAVEATYGVSPDFASPAYLERYDRPLLIPRVRRRLEQAAAGGNVRMALYTARPSLPPVEADRSTKGYSPEAEMARSLVGLEGQPLVGMGRMRWLAQRVGEGVERLVKPSPVQALAAVGAAWSGREAAALEAALALQREGTLRPPLAGMGPVAVHVFEDAPTGLEAVERGVGMLRAAGLDVDWHPYGVVPADGPKARAMATRGVPTYLSVNEAVIAALAGIPDVG